MLPSNLPILKQMISDAGFRDFAFELDEMFREDPDYTPRHGRQIFESAAKGERIIPFEDRYVISSFVPPVPSRAFKTFVSAGVDKSRLYKDLAMARRSAPLTVHLCITTRCPYRCEHCGATATVKISNPRERCDVNLCDGCAEEACGESDRLDHEAAHSAAVLG